MGLENCDSPYQTKEVGENSWEGSEKPNFDEAFQNQEEECKDRRMNYQNICHDIHELEEKWFVLAHGFE